MRLLLDTHTAIWTLVSASTIPAEIHKIISDTENDVFVSVVSLWEIAIKFRLRGRRRMPLSAIEALNHFRRTEYGILEISAEHAIAVEALDLQHTDPFDMLILAQAVTEPLRLATKDRKLARYSDAVISW